MTETKSPRNKLFLMMVMEFFIWGAWLPLIFGYLPSLGFTPVQQAWILNAFPLSAIVGMFFSNQFADRHFAAEKFLGFSHLVGGLAILALGFTRLFWPFFGLMLVHCLFYVPTISIANSIAFAHMKDAKKEFGLVRMGGTFGWILAAWPFTFIFVDWARVKAAAPKGLVDWLGTALASGLTGQALKQATRWTFIVAGIVSVVLAAYSLLLPHTPPKKRTAGTSSTERFAWLEAVKLLKHPFVLVLWLITFIDAFVHNLYFNWTGTFLGTAPEAGGVGIAGNWIMPVMSLGQVSEILTMLILGVVLKKLGWRFTMLIGILGHAARFAVYAFFPSEPWMIVAIQVLHGDLLRVLLRHGLHFRGHLFPEGRPLQRSGAVQRDDPRTRRTGRQYARSVADPIRLHGGRHHGLPVDVPAPLLDRARSRDRPGLGLQASGLG